VTEWRRSLVLRPTNITHPELAFVLVQDLAVLRLEEALEVGVPSHGPTHGVHGGMATSYGVTVDEM
jgi:hypothetical protein